jgi:hypothetical protein
MGEGHDLELRPRPHIVILSIRSVIARNLVRIT